MERWLKGQPKLSFVKPRAGTTAFLKMEFDMPAQISARGLLTEKGVLLVPGSVMDREGYLRIGYANTPEVIAAGLDKNGRISCGAAAVSSARLALRLISSALLYRYTKIYNIQA